jgi:hypothetical protein
MKKAKNGLMIAVCFLFLGTGVSFAEQSVDVSRLRGRDIAEIGKITTIEGVLKLEGTEWVLLTSDKNYEIHLGPESFRESKGFQLIEGDQAIVKGFLIKTDIAVMEIESNDKTIILRDSNGRPAWAGSRFASGINANSEHDHDGQNHQEAPKNLESLDDLGDI